MAGRYAPALHRSRDHAPAPRRRPELLHKYPWPARSPNGSINVASMLDMQSWFVKNKMSNADSLPTGSWTRAMSRMHVQQARAVRAREQGQQARRLPLTPTHARRGENVDALSGAARRSTSSGCARSMSAAPTAWWRSTTSACTSRRASSSASSVRRAAGNRRYCASSPASTEADRRHHQGRGAGLGGRERDGVPGARAVSLDERRGQCRLRPR